MLRYCVLLKCEVVKKKTSRDTEVLTAEKTRYRMLRYFVTLKCEVKKNKTLHAAVLCDTEV